VKRFHAWVGLVAAALTTGCHPAGGQALPPNAAGEPPSGPADQDRLSPEADPAWRRARAGEAIDLEILARQEGAAALVSVARRGDPWARVALAAFPLAPEAAELLGPLCGRLGQADPSQAELMIRAIHGVLSEPPRATEQVDPSGAAKCATPLRSAAENRALSAAARDFALSALEMLGERAPAPAAPARAARPN
jgi:hypothetical protein